MVRLRSLPLILFLAVLVSARSLAADTIAVGFPGFEELNVVDSDHPAAVFVRRAIGQGLVSAAPPQSAGVRLTLAESVIVAPKHDRWSFRVRRGASFSSGRRVTGQDVAFSVNRCRSGSAGSVIKGAVARKSRSVRGFEEWVDVDVVPSTIQPSDSPFRVLFDCPVYEASSAQLFGPDFGAGSNVIATGPYRVTLVKSGRSITLERTPGAARRGPDRMEVRGFSRPDQGLAALRAGVIDLLFLNQGDEEVERARKDETLDVFESQIYVVVRRRGLTFSCEEWFNLSDLRYL